MRETVSRKLKFREEIRLMAREAGFLLDIVRWPKIGSADAEGFMVEMDALLQNPKGGYSLLREYTGLEHRAVEVNWLKKISCFAGVITDRKMMSPWEVFQPEASESLWVDLPVPVSPASYSERWNARLPGQWLEDWGNNSDYGRSFTNRRSLNGWLWNRDCFQLQYSFQEHCPLKLPILQDRYATQSDMPIIWFSKYTREGLVPWDEIDRLLEERGYLGNKKMRTLEHFDAGENDE